MVKLDDNAPMRHFQLSSSGRFLIPLAPEIIAGRCTAKEKMDLKSSDPEAQFQKIECIAGHAMPHAQVSTATLGLSAMIASRRPYTGSARMGYHFGNATLA